MRAKRRSKKTMNIVNLTEEKAESVLSYVCTNKNCTILTEEKADGMFSDVCTNNEAKLWELGVVPYVFNDNVDEEFKHFVEEAMKEIENVSIIKFLKRTSEVGYIEIIDKGEFSSYVGRTGKKQELRISKDKKWPNPIGHTMHELMHVLGFYHEHSHPGRDAYLNVKARGPNYDKQKESDTVSHTGYDFNSIMHYHLSPDTMTLKQGTNAEIGQRNRLSDNDIKALNKLYPKTLQSQQQILYGATF